jgi:Tol biopolymer transport system component
LIGTNLDHFKIIAKLGEGGMGAVYRAEDTRLSREVAIKVLPEGFTADPERLARFEREAQVIAQLNHPKICSLYDMGGSGGDLRYLVMELVEGETLGERIGRGLEVGDAVNFALQMADALEAAHARGIVHRDLKPANVIVTPEGQVKVLDFGLAKSWEQSGVGSMELSQSPTLTAQMTQAGVILGTAAYMSPEQARGSEADSRADVWSWGVILYEMLTREQLFSEPTVSDTLAAVLRADFDWTKIPKETPRRVRTVLRRCLERDPRNRLHSIADARIELADETEEETSPSASSTAEMPRAKGSLLPWLVAVLAVALAGLAWLAPRPTPQPQRLVAQILPPEGGVFLTGAGQSISPDGLSVVFGVKSEGGTEQLWLHSLETGKARPLPGTEAGRHSFWAPNGQGLGFFTDSKLKVLWLKDEIVETLADASSRSQGTWNQNGIIVAVDRGSMFQIPAKGGPVREIFVSGSQLEFLGPSFLPDGVHFLYLSRDYSGSSARNQLSLASLDGSLNKVILESNSSAVYLGQESGGLVWWQDSNMRARKFDLDRLELTAEERLVQAQVQFDPPTGRPAFSVSATGTAVYLSGTVVDRQQLALVDRSGELLKTIGPTGNYYAPRLSPDGLLVAVDRSDLSNRGDVWIYDVERGTGTRLTTAPQDESDPVWSPDGSQMTFRSNRVNPQGAIHLGSVRAGSNDELLYGVEKERVLPVDWSAHDLIMGEVKDEAGQLDLGVYSMRDGDFMPLATTRFNEYGGTFSPDGRYVAYISDETGRLEVYVQSFPDPADRIQVSTDGGDSPTWRDDGGEIYFVNHSSEMVAVPIRGGKDGSALRLGPPEVLFKTDLRGGSWLDYDTIDGEVFLLNRRVPEPESITLTLVINAFPADS